MQATRKFIRRSSLSLSAAVMLAVAMGSAQGQTPDHGKFRAVIRSADYPCAHVKDVREVDANTWDIQCNSGFFLVTRSEDGTLSAVKKAEASD